MEDSEGLNQDSTSIFEKIVFEVWGEILRDSDIDPELSFFELGGSSLQISQVVSHLTERTNRAISLRQAFEDPTIRGMAEHLANALDVPSKTNEYFEFGRRQILSSQLNHLLQGFNKSPEVFIPPNNTGIVLRLRGQLDIDAAINALKTLYSRHESLRLRFQGDGVDGFFFGVDPPDIESASIEHLSMASWDEANEWCRERYFTPFDRIGGVLSETVIISLPGDEHLLMIKIDHLLADGWSAILLMREFSELYDSSIEGRPPVLGDAASFSEYVSKTHEWHESDEGRRCLERWKKRLKTVGPDPTFDFPFARRGSRFPALKADSRTVQVPEDYYAAMGTLPGNATPFALFTAVVASLLHAYTGEKQIALVTPVANRTDPSVSNLVGWVANTVVLNFDIDLSMTLTQIAVQARGLVIEALDDSRYCRHRLIQELRPEEFGNVRRHANAYIFDDGAFAENIPAPNGISAQEISWPLSFTRHGLSFSIGDAHRATIGIRLESDWLLAQQLDRLAADLRVALEAFISQPERTLRELSAKFLNPVAIGRTPDD